MIRSIVIVFTIFFLTHNAVNAGGVKTSTFHLQGGFTGIVKDAQTNLPLQGVSVYFADIKVGGTTDEQGRFVIHHIPEGKHLVEISHIGYSTIAEQIEIIGTTSRDYFLMESVVENNAVIITGLGSASPLKKSPFQVSLLRKDDLMQSSSINIIDALTKKPGVSSLSSGPAIAKPVIRGLGYNRVLTINDGVRQEGQQWGDEHGIEIDESSVNKVEILKGPATLIYGSDAIAGVINIITNVPVENNSLKANVLSN